MMHNNNDRSSTCSSSKTSCNNNNNKNKTIDFDDNSQNVFSLYERSYRSTNKSRSNRTRSRPRSRRSSFECDDSIDGFNERFDIFDSSVADGGSVSALGSQETVLRNRLGFGTHNVPEDLKQAEGGDEEENVTAAAVAADIPPLSHAAMTNSAAASAATDGGSFLWSDNNQNNVNSSSNHNNNRRQKKNNKSNEKKRYVACLDESMGVDYIDDRTMTSFNAGSRRCSKRSCILVLLLCTFLIVGIIALGLALKPRPKSTTTNKDGDKNSSKNNDEHVHDNNNTKNENTTSFSTTSTTILIPPEIHPTVALTAPPVDARPPPPAVPEPIVDHCPQHPKNAPPLNFDNDNEAPISVSANTLFDGTYLQATVLQACTNDDNNNNNNNSNIGGDDPSITSGVDVATSSSTNNNQYGGVGIWYVLTGPGGVVRVSTCNLFSPATFDTKLSIYTSTSSTCENNEFLCVAMDDNSCEFSDGSKTSWYAERGRDYYIIIHGAKATDFGDFTLSVELAPIGTCDAAITTSVETFNHGNNNNNNIWNDPTVVVGSLLGAKISLDPCSAGVVGRGGEVWYQVTGTGHWLQASTCHDVNEFPPRLALYKGDCQNLQCATPMHYQQDNDCGLGNSLSWYANTDEIYYIMVYKTNYLPGISFGLSISEFEPPSNDNCTGAIELEPDGSIMYGSTLQATYIRSQAAKLACNGTTYDHPGVWFTVRGTGTTLTASTCDDSTNFDTRITIFAAARSSATITTTAASCNELQCIADNDQWCGYQSSVGWLSTSNVIYYILVHGSQAGGVAPSIGSFGLAVYEFTPTINNDCVDAIGPLPVDSSIVTLGSTQSASVDRVVDSDGSDVTCPDGIKNEAPGVWYTVMGTGKGIHASTCGSETDFDTRITVYVGNGCDSLRCLITDDNGCGFQSQVYWPSTSGQLYYILVHGNFFSSFGDFGLRISPYSPNTIHDFCSGGVYTEIDMLNIGSTKNATFDGAETCVVPNTAPGVWYRIGGIGDRMIASTCHIVTDYDTRISVFRGTCANLECVAGNDDGIDLDDDDISRGDCKSGSSRVSWLSNVGELYSILVHGWGARTGVFGLTIQQAKQSVPNDFCVGALPLWDRYDIAPANYRSSSNSNGIFLQQHGSNINATFDDVPVCGDIESNGRGIWYRGITGGRNSLSSNRFVVSTCNEETDFDTQISVFRGTCGQLECVGGNDDDLRCGATTGGGDDHDKHYGGGRKQSSVTFVLPNYEETFYILIHGTTSSSNDIGQFTFYVEEIPESSSQVASNDFCNDAIRLPVIITPDNDEGTDDATDDTQVWTSWSPSTTTTDPNFVQLGSTIGATYDHTGTCIVPNSSPGVWYAVIGTGNILVATTCHEETDFDTRISVFCNGCNMDPNNNNNNGNINTHKQEGNYNDKRQGNMYDSKRDSFCVNLECVTGNDDTTVAKKATTIKDTTTSSLSTTTEETVVVVVTETTGLQTHEEQRDTTTKAKFICDVQSTAYWLSSYGDMYYILVHGFGPTVGNFGITVRDVSDGSDENNII